MQGCLLCSLFFQGCNNDAEEKYLTLTHRFLNMAAQMVGLADIGLKMDNHVTLLQKSDFKNQRKKMSVMQWYLEFH